MASSKVMPSTSNSTNSDLNSLSSHHHHHHNLHNHNHNRNLNQFVQPQTQMIPEFDPNNSNNVDGILRDVVYGDNLQESATINNNFNNRNSSLFDTEITLIDAAGAISAIGENVDESGSRRGRKTAEEVWREIVNGKSERKECKVEAVDEMMTLEDFLAKESAEGIEGEEVEVEVDEEDVKVEVDSTGVQMSGDGRGLFGFDHGLYAPQQIATPMGGVMGYGNGGGGGSGGMEGLGGGGGGGVRGKRRGGPILEPLDKAAQQRQRRMIKNRESAARSRERKQAYQVELETLALKLEEENEQLLREKAERTKKRLQQLMEKVVPVVEKRRPPRVLRRVSSMP